MRHSDLSAPCYLADVSDQAGEVWDALADWLKREAQPVDYLMVSGAGPLIWVRDGHVVAHAFPNSLDQKKLEAASNSIWA